MITCINSSTVIRQRIVSERVAFTCCSGHTLDLNLAFPALGSVMAVFPLVSKWLNRHVAFHFIFVTVNLALYFGELPAFITVRGEKGDAVGDWANFHWEKFMFPAQMWKATRRGYPCSQHLSLQQKGPANVCIKTFSLLLEFAELEP